MHIAGNEMIDVHYVGQTGVKIPLDEDLPINTSKILFLEGRFSQLEVTNTREGIIFSVREDASDSIEFSQRGEVFFPTDEPISDGFPVHVRVEGCSEVDIA